MHARGRFSSRACAQLTTTAIDVLPSRIAQSRDDAVLVQIAGQFGGAFPGRASELKAVDGVVGNEVHHRVFAGEKLDKPVHLRVAVVDAFKQGPLILDRIARCARVDFTHFNEFCRIETA